MVDVYEPDTFELVKHRIDLRNTANSKLVSVKLSDYNQVIIFVSLSIYLSCFLCSHLVAIQQGFIVCE